jgi:type II secretory pathway predicted ATPase ExeA
MRKIPNPNKRKHPATNIGLLLNKYAISLADIAQCLLSEKVEFNSRSTLHRMVHGQLSEAMRQTLYPPTARCLSKFLVARGLDKSQIDAELSFIFKGEYHPMINQRLELSPELCRAFNFRNERGEYVDPFSNPPQDRDEVFIDNALKQVVDRVIDAIKYPVFLSVTGPIGSGKSTLRALVEDYVADDTKLHVIWPEFFDMNKVTPMQIARAILKHFGFEKVPRDAESLGEKVKQTLETRFKNNERICLAFDECHRLNESALSSLKNFFEMGSGGFRRYMSVLLFGQPVFEKTLEDPKFRELYERIVPVRMPDFRKSAAAYLQHRLQLVGRDLAELFDQDAIDIICRQAETPLALGNIANEALRVSKEVLDNDKVIGEAIATQMHFSMPGNTSEIRQTLLLKASKEKLTHA